MEDTKHIKISEFNYPLPDERIAKFPLATRDQSKLLVYRHGEVSEDIFTSLPHYLESGELMIFNNTKVIQARMHFGIIEYHQCTSWQMVGQMIENIFRHYAVFIQE